MKNLFRDQEKARIKQIVISAVLRVCFFMTLFLLLVSCTSPASRQLDAVQEATVIPAAPTIISATWTLTNEPVKVVPTSTFVPAKSSAPILETGVLEDAIPSCSNAAQPLPITMLPEVQGFILYSDQKQTQWYVLTGSPPQETRVPFPAFLYDSVAFSPDAQWAISYAYHPEHTKPDHANIQLIGPGGQSELIELDMSSISQYVFSDIAPTYSFQNWPRFSWVNNQLVEVLTTYSETPGYGFPSYQYGYYDIDQRTWWEDLILELPNREPYGLLVLSSDLHHVLYVTLDNEVVLWDRGQQKIVWSQPDFADTDHFVASWALDSRYLAFGYSHNIQIISRDGNLITTVKNIRLSNEKEKLEVRGFYRWSPDGRRLAIMQLLQNEQEQTWQPMLYVYDLETETFVYRCPLADTRTSEPYIELSWSPDGNFILSGNGWDDSIPIRAFDLQTYSIYQLERENSVLVGWSQQFPLQLK